MESYTSEQEESFEKEVKETPQDPKCWCMFYVTNDDMVMMDFGFDSDENMKLLTDVFAAIKYTDFIKDTLRDYFVENQADKEQSIAIAQMIYLLSQKENLNPKNRDFISPLLNEVRQVESDIME